MDSFVLSEQERIVDVACGDSHSMARSRDGGCFAFAPRPRQTQARPAGNIYTWGSGSYGRLGLGTDSDQYTPEVRAAPCLALRPTGAGARCCRSYRR
jgi:alpha-tubulin suppressor-like RCC1 family protein